MKTISFYSYKGGVGRSLALAYTAKYLADCNMRVCVLDIDLEAPGIGIKFEKLFEKEQKDKQKQDTVNKVYSKLGVVDYINSFINGKIPDEIGEYFSDVPIENKRGYIKIMGAGKDIYSNKYWEDLENIEWKKLFSGKFYGWRMFEILKSQIEEQMNPDYLLIDSRAGVTTMSKVCTTILPDKVVMCLANNGENFTGSAMMHHYINNSPFNNNELEIICAITRFPSDEEETIEEGLSKYVDDPNKKSDSSIKKEFYKEIEKFYGTIEDAEKKRIFDNMFFIHSNREVERDELVILQKKPFVERETLVNDYSKIIYELFNNDDDIKLLAERDLFNKKEQKFVRFNLSKIIDNELKGYQNDMSFEDFWKDIKKCKIKSPKSSELLYKDALCERYDCERYDKDAYDNKISDVIEHLSSMLQNGEDDDEWEIKARYLRGIILLYDKYNYEASIKDLEKVVLNNFSNSHLNYDLASCYYCLGCPNFSNCSDCSDCDDRFNFENAMKYIELYISESKDDYRALLLKAKIKEKNNQTEKQIKEIIDCYDVAIAHENKPIDSHNHKGHYYFKLGKKYYNDALVNYNEAINNTVEKGDQNNFLYRNRGNLYFQLGKEEQDIDIKFDYYNKALIDYDKAIANSAFGSLYVEVCNKKGEIFASFGEKEKAIEEYRNASMINQKYNIYRNRLNKPRGYYKALETLLHYYDFQYGLYYDGKDEIDDDDKYTFDVKYHKTDELFEFIVIRKDKRVMLSDQGRAFKILDKLFELGEREVTKNLTNILKEFNVFKNGFDFSIEICNIEDKEAEKEALKEAIYRLFRCVSFINKMYIFYENIPNRSRFKIEDERKSLPRPPDPTTLKYQFPAKYCKYKINDEEYEPEYEFARVEKDGKTYITDQGQTYHMLDAVFDLREHDVQKNLNAIMEICDVLQIDDEFLIEINTLNENSETKNSEEKEIKHRLLECVSFMNTMRLFYV